MRISKIQNSSFSNQNHQSRSTGEKHSRNNTQKAEVKTSTSRALVTTQTTEYKRFSNPRQHSDNAFLAQYIDQSSTQRSRGFIGRKPAWQAKNSYQNSQEILDDSNQSHLDTSV